MSNNPKMVKCKVEAHREGRTVVIDKIIMPTKNRKFITDLPFKKELRK